MEKVYEELLKIRGLLEILARGELKNDLEGVATTPERRKIWTLCDGLTSTDEVAKEARITRRAVQTFINELQQRDLITVEKRGYPKRKYDYIPSDWKVR